MTANAAASGAWRWLLLLALALLVALFFLLDLPQTLSVEALRDARSELLAWRQRAPLSAAAAYALVYVLVTGLSLPGAAVLTLAGGAVFGLGLGTLLVSFASSAGATIAFLLARTLLRQPVQQRFGARLAPIEAGLRRDGVLYLLSLRLVPVVPFFLVNVVMGLTPLPTRSFYLASQIGMLPGTLVYVNAGTQLAQLRSLGGSSRRRCCCRWRCWLPSPGSRGWRCRAGSAGRSTAPGPDRPASIAT